MFLTTPTLAAYHFTTSAKALSLKTANITRRDNTHPQSPSIEREALALRHENSAILLALHLRHERRLMHLRIELDRIALGIRHRGIEALKTMLLQRVHQDGLGHLQTRVQLVEIFLGRELLSGNGGESAVEVVDGLGEIGSEALDSEGAGTVDVALCALLEVAEVGDGAEVAILQCG